VVGRPENPRRAFSIIEVIVVVVLIALLATVIVPRLGAMTGRHVWASAEQVGDLLSMAARRESLSSQQVSVEYNEANHSIVLMALVPDTMEGGSPSMWRTDRFFPPVSLGDTVISVVEIDGAALDPRSWRIEFTPGVRRPAVTIGLTDEDGKETWRVELPSLADHAVVNAGSAARLIEGAVDLDATGAGSSPW
jgi:prepilin-type N-terminal cleavage/methylation domain-containing protein